MMGSMLAWLNWCLGLYASTAVITSVWPICGNLHVVYLEISLHNPLILFNSSAAQHLNINLQMNYWPSLPCNLRECQEPLFDYLSSLSVNGSKTAKVRCSFLSSGSLSLSFFHSSTGSSMILHVVWELLIWGYCEVGETENLKEHSDIYSANL